VEEMKKITQAIIDRYNEGQDKVKVCTNCKEKKKVTEFFKNKTTEDGYHYWCKECKSKANRKYNELNKKSIRLNKKKYNESHREILRKSNKSWKNKNPHKIEAERKISYAIRIGKIKKQNCTKCDSSKDLHAHHEDYTKPLEIIWLCRTCHFQRHKEMREIKANT
jgi:hypothetical protein